MSTLINSARAGARNRVPRFAEAAVERARLTVVPPRGQLGRSQAARTPFAVLVLLMLAGGVVGLLMFNTHMQQTSFRATALQNQVNELTAKEQSLDMDLDKLRDPQSLATKAKRLGMVAPAQPAFVRLTDGKVLGTPTPATLDGAVRVNPMPAQLPDSLKPRKIFVKAKVTPPAQPTRPGGVVSSPTDTPGTSTNRALETDRKRANTQADSGATR